MKTEQYLNDTCQPSENQTNVAYTQFATRYDIGTSAIWCWMQPALPPCMNTTLLDELLLLQQQLTTNYQKQPPDIIWPFRHFILASKIPGIFNLGGDLKLFQQCINDNEEDKLRDYAYKCVDLVHSNINNLDLPITTVSLVQGQALGGGFEAALSCDVIVAELSSQMGFPEILFNLFPGMGAYNLLARRIGPAMAERLILSGKTYSASKLYDMGIVDILADDGEGKKVIDDYLNSHTQSHNTLRSMKRIRQIVHPITRQNLIDIVDIWVGATMNLSEKDLSRLERILYLQGIYKNRKNIKEQYAEIIMRGNDWRKVKKVSFPLKTHLGDKVLHDRRRSDRRQRSNFM